MSVHQIPSLFLVGVAVGYAFIYLRLGAVDLKQVVHRLQDASGPRLQQLLIDIQQAEAANLFGQVRVLCWICTHEASHHLKAVHAKATWGRHCNKLLIVSEADDPTVPTVHFDVAGNRSGLWAKTGKAFQLIEKEYLNDYDWFLKADDDSYVVLQYLRKMLLLYDTEDPIFFGCHLKVRNSSDDSGMTGSGYVLSRESVRRLVRIGFSGQSPNDTCRPITEFLLEDYAMSKCMRALGVHFGDSRDEQGRHRFNHLSVDLYTDQLPNWYYARTNWPVKKERDVCCSEHPVTFHHMTADKFYLMEYLLYHVNVVPVTQLVRNPPMNETFLNETGKPWKKKKQNAKIINLK